MAFFANSRPAAPGLSGGFFGTSIGNTLTALGSWNDKRITRRELRNLSERELEDIGLNRADIDDVVQKIR